MSPELQTNALYYGDNLDILRRYVPDASANRSNAQVLAFDDSGRE